MTTGDANTLNTASSKQVTKQPHTKPLRQRIWEHRMDYLLISPFFIIYGIFHFYPLMWALWLVWFAEL